MADIRSELYFFNKLEVPRLEADDGSYMLSSSNCTLKLGEILYFPSVNKTLEVKGISLLLGKTIPVDSTETGHRYLISFGTDEVFPANVSGNVTFFKMT